MRIAGNEANRESAGVRPDPVRPDRPGAAAGTGRVAADRVELSSQLALVDRIIRAANETPDIRQDQVERARAKLASGELAGDLFRLADRLIDHVLVG